MKLVRLLPFTIYSLTTIFFTIIYISLNQSPTQPFIYDKKTPEFVVLIQALGHAAGAAGQKIGEGIRYFAICVGINLLYFIVLTFLIGLPLWKSMILFILTLILAILAYGLLYPILNWVIGEYYSAIITLMAVTLVVSRWKMNYSEPIDK